GGLVVATGPPQEVLTPEVLEPVYRVVVTPVDAGGIRQLLLSLPRASTESGAPHQVLASPHHG
ncbi:MAG: hypothetical protein ACRCYU_14260, partial [Nocardioides sp.]